MQPQQQLLVISILKCILLFTDAHPHNSHHGYHNRRVIPDSASPPQSGHYSNYYGYHNRRGIPDSASRPQSGHYSNYYGTVINNYYYGDNSINQHPKEHSNTQEESNLKALHANYVYGRCAVRPNEFPPSGEIQQIKGTVEFRQLATGGHTDVKVFVEGFDADDENTKHGFHVHEVGDLTRGCQSLGGHFNPFGKTHGAPHGHSGHGHVGDLGNLEEDSKGRVNTTIPHTQLSLTGDNSIYGRAMVVHQGADDLGKGGNEGSKKTGNAGGRLACCIIGKIESDSGWAH